MIEKICSSIRKIQDGSIMNFEYNKEHHTNNFRNEFVILIKPECFLITHSLFEVVNVILNICNNHNIILQGFKAFNGLYAQKYAYMENEYYMLNRGAHYGFEHLPFEYKEKIINKYKNHIVIGAYGFLNYANKSFTAKTLEEITETQLSDKIGNGTYVLPLKYNDEKYAIINAFHPEQINHFYNPKHITVALFCASDTDYNKLANKCIGHYAPQKAEVGSIRHNLYQHQDKYGIIINNLFNGVHISPSPLEGMFGLYRYSQSYKQNLTRSSLCKNLISIGVNIERILTFLENPTFFYQGRPIDIFNLCESKNGDEITSIIQEIII